MWTNHTTIWYKNAQYCLPKVGWNGVEMFPRTEEIEKVEGGAGVGAGTGRRIGVEAAPTSVRQ